jgi:hypothetical protein
MQTKKLDKEPAMKVDEYLTRMLSGLFRYIFDNPLKLKSRLKCSFMEIFPFKERFLKIEIIQTVEPKN